MKLTNSSLHFVLPTVQVQDISNVLATETDYVDWRRLLLALTWPIPTPTQAQLLETLKRFRDMDQKNTGFVTREQYDRVGFGDSCCLLT